MKRHASYALSILLSFLVTTGFCQTNELKPKQFSNFPEIINCSEDELSKAFTAVPGQDISLTFSNNFIFTGSVKSNLARYSNLQSVVIVSPDYSNTIFNVSKISNADGTTSYVGRIINKNYFDGFELKKNASGTYQLKKVETDRVIQDCKL
ncbi:MAG: hypothetical protein WAT20_10695 [Ferruginibacter sp.]|nr:hypothetical protein [Chitinophagaceae bacterium]